MRPLLSGEDIQRYELCPTAKFILIPYEVHRVPERCRLLPAATLRKDYPLCWRYLKSCEAALRERESGRMDHDGWYGYVYPKNLHMFGVPRIVVRDIIDRGSFAIDPAGEFAFVSGYGIILQRNYRSLLSYVAGLLNSSWMTALLKNISTTLRGGWFRPFPQFLRQLPIKLPETADEKRIAEQFANRVERIIDAKKRLQAGKLSEREENMLHRQIESDEQQIDDLVCRLYGVEALPGP